MQIDGLVISFLQKTLFSFDTTDRFYCPAHAGSMGGWMDGWMDGCGGRIGHRTMQCRARHTFLLSTSWQGDAGCVLLTRTKTEAANDGTPVERTSVTCTLARGCGGAWPGRPDRAWRGCVAGCAAPTPPPTSAGCRVRECVGCATTCAPLANPFPGTHPASQPGIQSNPIQSNPIQSTDTQRTSPKE